MNSNASGDSACPRCAAVVAGIPLYKCVRCFSVYCQQCVDTDGGRRCPKCGMPQRIVLTPYKPAATGS